MLPRQKGSIVLRTRKENLHDPNTEHAEAEFQREQARSTAASAGLSLWVQLLSRKRLGCERLKFTSRLEGWILILLNAQLVCVCCCRQSGRARRRGMLQWTIA